MLLLSLKNIRFTTRKYKNSIFLVFAYCPVPFSAIILHQLLASENVSMTQTIGHLGHVCIVIKQSNPNIYGVCALIFSCQFSLSNIHILIIINPVIILFYSRQMKVAECIMSHCIMYHVSPNVSLY